MKRLYLFFTSAILALGLATSSQAAVVKVIESPGLPGHDLEWVAVAAGLGHTVTLDPVTDLSMTFWIPTTDLLIITDPFFPYTPLDMGNVHAAMMGGVSVYIQGEDDPLGPGNIMFDYVINATGVAGFSWVAALPGSFTADITGPVAMNPNARVPLLDMDWACEGTSPGPITGVVPNMFVGVSQVGFMYDEISNPFAGAVAVNTDFTWILPFGPDVELMENYIESLLTADELNKFVYIAPTGPTSVPSTGGPMPYEVALENIGISMFPTTVWVRLFLPSGALYPPPLAGPAVPIIPSATYLGPFPSPGFLPALYIPAFAPPGRYHLQAAMTNGYPGFTETYDSDFFPFDKTIIPGPDDSIVPEDELPENAFGTGLSYDFLAGASDDAAPDAVETLPRDYQVSEAWPNPFNPSTTVNVTLAEASELTMTVYDVQGREVAILANDSFSAGSHQFSFDAHGLASGVYFLRATVPGKLNQTRKLVLMR